MENPSSLKSRATSPLVKVFLETPLVRVAGRKIFPIYEAKLPTGDRILLRSKFDWDASTVNEVYTRNIYEKRHTISEGDVVVDVGAHIGSFTLKAAREVGGRGRVISIEPHSRSYELLARNIALNAYHNVTPLNVGLGSVAGDGNLYIRPRSGENSMYDRGMKDGVKSVAVEQVNIATLDSIASQSRLQRLDFLKIDVEGFELDVLKGGSKVLREFRPNLAMETHSWGPSSEEISKYLREFGYNLEVTQYHNMLGLLYAW